MDFQYTKKKLFFKKLSLESLAKRFKTPFYLYDFDGIGVQIERFQRYFPGEIHYAVKANSNPDLLKFLRQKKIGADIVSGGELRKCLKAGFKGSDIVFSGVGKTQPEIELALQNQIKLFNVEGLQELELIAKLAKKKRKKANIALRFNPDVSPDVHPYITTGFRENKFGMDETFLPEFRKILEKNKSVLKMRGVSLHIGSQLLDLKALQEAISKTIPIFRSFRADGHDMRYFDVGGGLGISYQDDEAPASIEQYGTMVRSLLMDLDVTPLCEPGRVLVGASGALISKVLYTKSTTHKNFVIVDTGMHHLIRPALYQAYHKISPVTLREGNTKYDFVGPICESADFLGQDRVCTPIEPEDLVVIHSAGAYGYSMVNDYNSHARPSEVAVVKGKAILLKS